MAIEMHPICTNCKGLVPEQCDGMVFTVSEWGPESRGVCRGSDGDNFTADNKYRITRGMGVEYEVPLILRQSSTER